MNWREVAKGTAARGVSMLPLGLSAARLGLPLGPVALGAAGVSLAGGLGSGYLDKYTRMIAVNELDNARGDESKRDAEKLHRLRRQVSTLEDRVEGDGWKKDPIMAQAAPKDSSGKSW